MMGDFFNNSTAAQTVNFPWSFTAAKHIFLRTAARWLLAASSTFRQ